MDGYFNKQSLNCINEFIDLMHRNDYISLKSYNLFLDKYSDIFELNNKYNYNKDINGKINYISNKGYDILENHNNIWVNREIMKNKDFLDNMFNNIDPNIKLDDEQKRAVVVDEDYSLIIAGAGSGKTTTIAAKVNYLVNIRKVDPKKIAVISFTNKATEELENRIVDDFQIPVSVTTFHALGIKYIRKIMSNAVGIVSEYEQKRIIEKYIIDKIFPDKQKLEFIVQNFSEYFSKGFKENYKKFETFDEYFKDYKTRKYEKEKDHLKSYNANIIEGRLKFKYPISIKNEIYKSIGEAKIANFLFKNGIEYEYEYEKIFPEKVDEDRAYHPDFTIDYHGKPIYIEYFGLSSYYENGTISEKKLKRYKSERSKKLDFFKSKKGLYDLIELDYYNIGDNDEKCYYISILKNELLKRGIELKPKNDFEIFNAILEGYRSAEFYKFIDIIIKSINIIKEEDSLNSFYNTLYNWINQSNLDEFEYIKYQNQLNVITDFIKYYQKYVISNHVVDYADMIIYAHKYINRVYDTKHELDYEYIIIDEYQDISLPRYLLAKKISDKYSAKIIAVGDDWQSIFAFTGSNVKLFYDFEDLFPGAEMLKISNTYRNSQQLIDVASSFVLENPEQIYKDLVSRKKLIHPIEIYYYDEDNEYKRLNELIKNIYYSNKDDEIMILVRRTKEISSLENSDYFEPGKDDHIICKEVPLAKITVLTIHRSKGLGADQVIVLNLADKNLPLQFEKEYWLTKVLRPTNNEKYPFAEERRIFYVALTRTKNKVYLFAPYDNYSSFIQELIINENVIENKEN